MFLKFLQDSQENTTVLEPIFNFILSIFFKSILQVSSYEFCKILKRAFFTEHFLMTASALVLLANIYRDVEHLEGVISAQIVFSRSFNIFWHVSDGVQNDFSFDNF